MQIHWSAIVLAQKLGQVLTPEVAKAIVLEIESGPNSPIDISQFTPLEYKGYVIQAEHFPKFNPITCRTVFPCGFFRLAPARRASEGSS